MVRILHIFSPTFGRDFSGHEKRWFWQYQRWDDTRVCHSLLLPGTRSMIPANEVSNICGDLPTSKLGISNSRWKRVLRPLHLCSRLVHYRKEFDILHVHIQLWSGLLSAPMANILDRPSLYEISTVGSDTPSALAHKSFGRLRQMCIRRFDRFLCTSEAAKLDCLASGVPERALHLLPNAVDTELFRPCPEVSSKQELRRRLHIPDDAVALLFVGSVKQRKGVDLLVEAFAALGKTFPNLFLIIIGPDSHQVNSGVNDGYVGKIKAFIEEARLMDRVQFVGRIDCVRLLVNYYQASNIFIFPTRAEGMPNALLESMASALPSVVSTLPGITDSVIRNGQNGFLVPKENVEAIVERTSVLIKDEPLRERLGKVARLHVLDYHNFSTWQDHMVGLYQSLAEE